jgi:methyl-accepting chemotaxis protein
MPAISGYLNKSSIFVKSLLMTAFVTILLASTTVYFNKRDMTALTNDLVLERGMAEADLLSSNLYGPTRYNDAEKIQAILQKMMEFSNGHGVAARVYAADGSLLSSETLPGGETADFSELGPDQISSVLQQGAAEVKGELILKPILRSETDADATSGKNEAVGVLVMQWSAKTALERTQAAVMRGIIATALLALAVIGISLWIIERGLLRPIAGLRHSINAIGSGDLDVNVPNIARRDELGSISASVESLRAVLKDSEGIRMDAAYKSAAFTAASACMMLADSDYTIRYANPAMIALLDKYRTHIPKLKNKVEGADVVGLTMEDFHANGDQIRKRLERMGKETVHLTVTFGEARVSLTIRSVFDEKDAQIGVMLEWADITQEWLNKAILFAIDSDQMRADFDIDGQLIWANPPLCKAMAASLPDLQGKSLRSLVANPAEGGVQADEILRIARETSAFKEMLAIKTQTGEAITVEGSFSCVRDASNKPIRYMLLGRDITLQRADMQSTRAAREALEREQNQVVDALRVGLRQLSGGDLTSLIEKPFAGSYEDLRIDYNQTVETLGSAMREIAENAENIKNESGDISNTADGLSRRTENTASTLEQTAAALDELTSSVKIAAQGAAEADMAVRDAKQNAEQSGVVVLETVSAMDQISESSEKITSIIKVIDDIAFQTNLLALNAGVEAARAGDAGRGFAVVASEVRALAQRSSDAAREINELIAKSSGQVKKGVDLVGRTGSALRSIVGSVSQISGLVSKIAESSQQQSLNLAEINQSVNQLDQSTQQNAARLEETTAASESLRKDAVALVETVSHFKNVSDASRNQSVVPMCAKATTAPARPVSPTAARPVKVVGQSTTAAVWEDF